jgi:hypothetical protein
MKLVTNLNLQVANNVDNPSTLAIGATGATL